MKKSTLIFIVLSGFASFCNYAIYPALSRILPSGEFVDVTVALALFTQLSSFMLSIVALTIGITKDSSEKRAKATVEKLQTILAHIFLVIVVVFLFLSPITLRTLQLPSPLLVPILIMLTLSLVMSIVTGYLNGKQKLVKLGFVIAGAASLQLVASIAVGIITKSGVLALTAMSIASLVSTISTYVICRGDNLPKLSTVLLHKLSIYRSKADRKLLTYTILASISALAINILLVLDLLIVTARSSDAVLYTDTYIISRIVFFAGTLLVWPFLSSLKLKAHHENIKKVAQLIAVFGLISFIACVIMYEHGERILKLLLGGTYNDPRLASFAILSILYKFIYLILTSLCLIFMLYRSYWAVLIPALLCIGCGIVMSMVGPSWTTESIVGWLSSISAAVLLLAFYGYWKVSLRAAK